MQPGAPPGVERLWARFRPLVLTRVELVQQYLDGDGTRAEARAAAHKLAGALGSYGRAEGSSAARRIEEMLEGDGPRPLAGSPVHGELARLRRSIG